MSAFQRCEVDPYMYSESAENSIVYLAWIAGNIVYDDLCHPTDLGKLARRFWSRMSFCVAIVGAFTSLRCATSCR